MPPSEASRRSNTALACGATPSSGTLGIAGAKIIAPGDPTKSVLQRIRSVQVYRMPPIGRNTVDVPGTATIEKWIQATTACLP